MKSSFVTFVTGFFFGTAIGTAIALLNAARPGRETREQLREGFFEVRSRAEEALSDAQAITQETVEGVKNLAREIGGEVENKVREPSEKLEDDRQDFAKGPGGSAAQPFASCA